tara:strand:- start:7 stop:588 length:582 start_codon:yes stop_codon:yes gene_type:complete
MYLYLIIKCKNLENKMKSSSLKIFSTAVHVIRISGWDKHKRDLLTAIKDQKDPTYRPRDGFYTDYGLAQSWRKAIWNGFLEPQLRSLIDGTHTKLQDIWAQQYIDQVGHTAHRHQPIGYSCVFYAEFDPKVHWATTVFRPFLDPNDVKNINEVFTPEVEEGDVFVFPSWMMHQATPSDTNVSRTIIAFNLEPR